MAKILDMLEEAIGKEVLELRRRKLSDAIYNLRQVQKVSDSDEITVQIQEFNNELILLEASQGDPEKYETESAEIVAHLVKMVWRNLRPETDSAPIGPISEMDADSEKNEQKPETE